MRSYSYLLHQRLEESASRSPEALALDGLGQALTYRELEAQANQIANTLVECGVSLGDRVGVYMHKSVNAIAALYGVMKAGAGYVPIDPQMPPQRVCYVAQDAGLRILVSESGLLPRVADLCDGTSGISSVIVLDDGDHSGWSSSIELVGPKEVAEAGDTPPRVRIIDTDLAYILYTSGSTGQPKGVMLSHRNALAFVDWAVGEAGLTDSDRMASHAPLHFDLSIFDLYGAATVGAALFLVPRSASVFPAELIKFVEGNQITVWYSVPSILSMVVERGKLEDGALASLRRVIFAGEVFPTRYLAELMKSVPQAEYHNWYGPTETNVCTAYHVPDVPDPADGDIPIGSPVANVRAYVIDDEGKPVPSGVSGELLIAGATVMRGYWGDPEKTASRLSTEDGEVRFRTGDLVVELPGGGFRFLGRKDHQVKSRGYRIELGEIESALYAHPEVTQCAVVAIPDEVISNRLKAYVLPANVELTTAELIRFCSTRIPKYMIPDEFEFLDQMPMTSTGKVDRQKLSD